MKRRGFLGALAGLVLLPRLPEPKLKLKPSPCYREHERDYKTQRQASDI